LTLFLRSRDENRIARQVDTSSIIQDLPITVRDLRCGDAVICARFHIIAG